MFSHARQREIEASTLIDAMQQDLALLVACLTCGRRIVMEPETIAQRRGPHFSIRKVKDKLKCSKCGSRNIVMRFIAKS